jgi:hypothetical protein
MTFKSLIAALAVAATLAWTATAEVSAADGAQAVQGLWTGAWQRNRAIATGIRSLVACRSLQ